MTGRRPTRSLSRPHHGATRTCRRETLATGAPIAVSVELDAAAWAGSSAPPVQLDLDPQIPPVTTDGERLRTAFVNILANARHAVDAVAANGAAPAVTLSTRRHPDRISVTVRDRGPGIATEDMAHIFDPFFTTRRAGTGLGLPIAKNIIVGLGGSLSIDSWPDAGTEIRIEIPLASVEPA